jgi:hypothetical protein
MYITDLVTCFRAAFLLHFNIMFMPNKLVVCNDWQAMEIKLQRESFIESGLLPTSSKSCIGINWLMNMY